MEIQGVVCSVSPGLQMLIWNPPSDLPDRADLQSTNS
jgi:hypothetical protein